MVDKFKYVFRSGVRFSESGHVTLGCIYTVREEREGGGLKQGLWEGQDAVCFRDSPLNKKTIPELLLCLQDLKGVLKNVWDGL